MKRNILLFLLFLGGVFVAKSQTQYLVVWMTNGKRVSYELNDLPKTTFSGDSIVISSRGLQVAYAKNQVQRYTYDDSSTGIDDINQNADISVTQNKDDYLFKNIEEGCLVTVYGQDGKKINQQRVGKQRSVNVSLGNLPAGVYVVKVDETNYKLIKK